MREFSFDNILRDHINDESISVLLLYPHKKALRLNYLRMFISNQ